MWKVVAILALVAVAAPATAPAAVPVPRSALLAVDRTVPIANFMPTLMLPGYSYARWSYRRGVLRIVFRGPGARTIVWAVEPMSGRCDTGKQKSFQLAGNKVWWAQDGAAQRAWRCTFAADGVPIRMSASSTTPPTRLADVGLGRVVASGKRY